MSIRNLDFLFRPESVALVGASKRPGSVGSVIARNLATSGFDGPIMPVNPKHRAVAGMLCYPDVLSLPVTPDLAVICTPSAAVPGIVDKLGQRGTRAAVVISAGFAETGEAGQVLQDSLLEAAQPYLLRMIGPNCVGIVVPGVGLNASFVHINPQPGHIAFLAQSGAVMTAVIDWAADRGFGFSHLVSLGNMADVDFGDMLDYLANDPNTHAILMYVEAITHPRKFLSAARTAARTKPVVVVKSGRRAGAAKAAASHTGALAGDDAVYDAVFHRAGMLRVDTLEDLFTAAEILSSGRLPKGERLAIVSNGGGAGVMAADALLGAGGKLAELTPDTLTALDKVLPANWSHGNPVDLIGDAPPERYRRAVDLVLSDVGTDAVLALYCPVAVTTPDAAASAVLVSAEAKQAKPVIAGWIGDHTVRGARRRLAEADLPCYETPEQAVDAFMHMVRYRRGRDALMETPAAVPEAFAPDHAAVRAVLARNLEAGTEWLDIIDTKAILDAYGIPVLHAGTAANADEAAELARRLDCPVALKIRSPDIQHKTDVGGVALDLLDADSVRQVASDMTERIHKALPDARLDGFAVEPMVRWPDGHELIVGAVVDPQFGPVVLFGHGGVAVEVVNDRAVALPPLNMKLARDLMRATRIYRVLKGYRGIPGVDLEAVALVLIKVAQLVCDFAEIMELDINPMLAGPEGVMALDARLRIAPATVTPASRLAIRPYPSELEQEVRLGDGRTLLLRPILPEDEPPLRETFAKLHPETVRLRFFHTIKEMNHLMAARLTQIDYDREMALVLTGDGNPGEAEIYGVVRISADPDNERAEYAVLVRDDMAGFGLGALLMRRIIDYARERGIKEVFGDVLRENKAMLGLCRKLGFTVGFAGEPGVVRVTLPLKAESASTQSA